MDNTQERTQETSAWLAGLVDSDGSITRLSWKSEFRMSPNVGITNCDYPTVEETENAWKSLGVPFYTFKHDRGNPNWAISYNTQVLGYKNCAMALEKLLPYLRGKRKVAELNLKRFAIRFKNQGRPTTPEEKDILKELELLNHRGTCDPQRLNAELKKDDFLQKIKSDLARNGQSMTETFMPSTLDLHWLGGVIDGDGHIGNFLDGKGHWSVRTIISNSNPLLLGYVILILDGLQLPYWIETQVKNSSKHKTMYHITVEGWKRCLKFLPIIKPYVRGKKRQASILHEVVQMRLSNTRGSPYTKEEVKLLEELRNLNRRGRRE